MRDNLHDLLVSWVSSKCFQWNLLKINHRKINYPVLRKKPGSSQSLFQNKMKCTILFIAIVLPLWPILFFSETFQSPSILLEEQIVILAIPGMKTSYLSHPLYSVTGMNQAIF